MYLAVVGVGLLAGFINTLAGGGSAISLPMLIFLGLPANVANGTNRIAILLQTAVGVGTYHKQKVMDFRKGFVLGGISLAGAIIGASLAINLNEFVMRRVIGAVLIIMLFLVVFKPSLWLKSQEDFSRPKNKLLSFIVFFIVGMYGGFIQVGVGFFLLASLVLVERTNLVKANAVKLLIILLYTPAALAIFIINKQVDYKLGFVLAIGNMLGAWLGAKVAVGWGPKFIRWVLIVALVGSALKLFEIV